MSLRSILLLSLPLVLIAAAPFGYSLATLPPPKPAAGKPQDPRKAAEKLCASRSVNDRLKARIFADAAATGDGPSSNLDLLASVSEVRMDQPLLKTRDEDLGVTVCTGRFVLLLPPGSEQRFGGRTLLQADVEYAAQPAADGSGLVYQLKGANSIIYKLAAYNLEAEPGWPDKKIQTARSDGPPAVTVFVPNPQSAVPTAAPVNPPVLAAAVPAPPPVKPAVAVVPPKPAPPVKEAKVEAPKPVKLVAAPTPKKPDDKAEKLAKAEAAKAGKLKKEKLELAVVQKAEKAAKLAAAQKAHKAEQVKLAAAEKAKAAKTAKLAAAEKSKADKARLAAAERAKTEKATKLAAALKAHKAEQAKLAAAEKAKTEKAKLAAAEKARKAEQVRLAAAEKARADKAEKLAALKAKQTKAAKLADARAKRNQFAKSVQLALRTPEDRCASGTAADRFVCENPGLAAKQRTATNVLNSALEDADQRTRRELNGTRARFAAYLQRCHSESCVANALDDRIAEIHDIVSN